MVSTNVTNSYTPGLSHNVTTSTTGVVFLTINEVLVSRDLPIMQYAAVLKIYPLFSRIRTVLSLSSMFIYKFT